MICTFQALREQLRSKEIWVVGADSYRNPDEDLPADFESRRDEYYATLRKPLDASDFIGELRAELRRELGALAEALPVAPWVEIADRGSRGAVKLAPLDATLVVPAPHTARSRTANVALAMCVAITRATSAVRYRWRTYRMSRSGARPRRSLLARRQRACFAGRLLDVLEGIAAVGVQIAAAGA